jgi:hypothetical protein
VVVENQRDTKLLVGYLVAINMSVVRIPQRLIPVRLMSLLAGKTLSEEPRFLMMVAVIRGLTSVKAAKR